MTGEKSEGEEVEEEEKEARVNEPNKFELKTLHDVATRTERRIIMRAKVERERRDAQYVLYCTHT